MSEKIEGILLSKVQHTSGAVVLNFLTDQGLKAFYFRGAQKKGSLLFPLAVGSIVYAPKTTGLSNMFSFDLIENGSFTADPRRVAVAFFIAELLARCAVAENPDPYLYANVLEIVRDLNQAKNTRELAVKYLVQLLEPLGISPMIESMDSPVFDLLNGVIRTGSHGETTPGGEEVHLISKFLSDENDVSMKHETVQRAVDLLIKYYKQHFPSVERLKSLEVLRETMI